ncbi:MAG: DUF2946 domain-containing protein [Dyella sp.]
MLAIWLTMVAPVVSLTLPAPSSWPVLGAWCEGHAGLVAHASDTPSHPHHDRLAKCGYCDLLNHSPGLSGDFFVAALLLRTPYQPRPLPTIFLAERAPDRSHAPRGPPSIHNA